MTSNKKKELKIQIDINTSFDFELNPLEEAWNSANDGDKNEYVKNHAREFLLEQIEEILNASKINYK